MAESTVAASDLDNLILNEYPYPIAVNYRRVLEAERWETKTRKCLEVFEYGVRTLALGLVSQYLVRDRDTISNDQLNRLLSAEIKRASLGTWNRLLFASLKAYGGKRELFFMPELYDIYWDTSVEPHRKRPRVQGSFDRLVQIRNEVAHHRAPSPSTEEAWHGLFREVFSNLCDVLSRFTFLQNYDLIRITGTEKDGYRYDIYTGQRVVSGQEPLRTEQALGEGWFYLSKDRTKFLQLHPLLIYWDEETAAIEEVRRDAAIFDKFTWQQLTYLATVLGMAVPITDRTAIAEFVRLVFETVEQVKREREAVERLTWWVLQRVARTISADRMGDARRRYSPEVYLQRKQAKEVFEGFLDSDVTCLLITGKSGVGKSNFILSLADAYADDPYVCTLLYNGARLSAEAPMEATLTRDFEVRLRLERRGGRGIEDLLAEIDRMGGMEARKVVLFIDAINENPAAKALLRRVDELVETTPYRWLKVVISCRPETWWTIKRGVRLAEHKYYRQPEREELGLELEGFTREELPAVYEMYRRMFGLQTAYEALPVQVRQVLRDPLTLSLVAETYEEAEIPSDITVSEIYQRYIKTLLDTERLELEDIVFLERELMPLMIGAEHIDNAVAGGVIANVRTTDGRSLFELIHSRDRLGSWRRVNQSYANLVDARILMMEEATGLDYAITFQYERFYEHFGGERLFRVLPTGDGRAQAYLDRIASIADEPYHWGVVRNALRIELERGDCEVTREVAQRGDFLAQDVFLAALVEYGQDNRVEACALLEKLYDPSEEGLTGWFRRQLRGKKRESSEQLNKVAVRGASQLNYIPLLKNASLSSSPAVRAVAAQNVYYLWERQWRERREENDGLNLLVGLSSEVRGSLGLPRLRVLEACLGISLQIVMDLVLFAESEDQQEGQEGLATLTQMWKSIFEDVLASGEQYSRFGMCQ